MSLRCSLWLADNKRLWTELTPPAGIYRLWQSSAKASEKHGSTAAVSQSGVRYDIDTRKSGGAAQRSLAHCHIRVTLSGLPVRLRAIFDDLA